MHMGRRSVNPNEEAVLLDYLRTTATQLLDLSPMTFGDDDGGGTWWKLSQMISMRQ